VPALEEYAPGAAIDLQVPQADGLTGLTGSDRDAAPPLRARCAGVLTGPGALTAPMYPDRSFPEARSAPAGLQFLVAEQARDALQPARAESQRLRAAEGASRGAGSVR
jgi:hypothetical protein